MKKPKRARNIDRWEHALTCPLPPRSSYEFLQDLRFYVMQHLNWVTHDLVMEDEHTALREIQRDADRLTRITSMLPDAAARMMEEYNKKIEIQRLATEGGVDRSFEARTEATRMDGDQASFGDESLSEDDVPF